MTHTCRTAVRPPGDAEPDPAAAAVVPAPGPGRPVVFVHAARTSGSTVAASSHRRLFTISTPASNYVTVNHAGGGLALGRGLFPRGVQRLAGAAQLGALDEHPDPGDQA